MLFNANRFGGSLCINSGWGWCGHNALNTVPAEERSLADAVFRASVAMERQTAGGGFGGESHSQGNGNETATGGSSSTITRQLLFA